MVAWQEKKTQLVIAYYKLLFFDDWQFYCHVYVQVAAEESKALEVSKLLKIVESLKCELEAANEEKINGCKEVASMQQQLELSIKDQELLHSNLAQIEELKRENTLLKVFPPPRTVKFILCPCFKFWALVTFSVHYFQFWRIYNFPFRSQQFQTHDLWILLINISIRCYLIIVYIFSVQLIVSASWTMI